ncbi:Thioredoxin- transmembrane protein 1 [Coelomomyces lativittatus]|nr:Thioredoxin- transmembrane protein 1 [Coelomomyces lativittatus]KAJ1510825.1 Thioredoxin- transmembrane protein 1 [Coelomomyces lativittatus]KAJ1512178.1 Thioredoxin- transmembrane protein 1 [Coelomomyces lativittatus]
MVSWIPFKFTSLVGIIWSGLVLFMFNAFIQRTCAAEVMELEDHEFDLLKTGTWLIQFYSPSCVYCSRYAKDFEHFAETTAKQSMPALKVAKINLSENPGLATRFFIVRVPTVYLIRNQKAYLVHDFSIPNLTEFIDTKWKTETPWNNWWSPFSYVGQMLGGIGRLSKFIQNSQYGFVFWILPFVVGLGGVYLYTASRVESDDTSPTEPHAPTSFVKRSKASTTKKQD